MKNLAIARRYAKALLLIGKEDGQTETYRKELSEFSELIEKETMLEQAINSPLYNAAGRRKVLETIIEKVAISAIMRSFLILLFELLFIIEIENEIGGEHRVVQLGFVIIQGVLQRDYAMTGRFRGVIQTWVGRDRVLAG